MGRLPLPSRRSMGYRANHGDGSKDTPRLTDKRSNEGSTPQGEPHLADSLHVGRWLGPNSAPILDMLYVA
jgi:hypothetical protein